MSNTIPFLYLENYLFDACKNKADLAFFPHLEKRRLNFAITCIEIGIWIFYNMRAMRYKSIDGRDLYYVFLAGSSRLIQHQAFLNKINVFPVPDNDTGSNLASTFRHIVERISPHQSLKNIVDAIASAALNGARGNSGIIFAQFFYGFSKSFGAEDKIDVNRFAQAIKNAFRHTLKAIDNPVEGTIVTVLRDWVNYIEKVKTKITDFSQLTFDSFKIAKKSLQNTPKKLAVLKKYKVVDAGAQGFVFFLEGIIDFLKERNIKQILRSKMIEIQSFKEFHTIEEISYRYCTEAIIDGQNLEQEIIKNFLTGMGDSLMIAGSVQKIRIHLHTDSPAEVFQRLRFIGELPFQKVDDMKRQYEIAHNKKWDIALVTDSVCDLPRNIMDKFQIHMVSINIHFGNSIYLDKKSLIPKDFYKMLEENLEFPTTSQPQLQYFLDLYTQLTSYYDSVIAVHMSKHLSGTWNASYQAAQKIGIKSGKKISVINSRHLSGSLGLIVLRTAEAISGGMDHDRIVNKINDWIDKSIILVSVKTLKYMVKGGRVSPMKGFLAKLLNLKPIVSLDNEGQSVLFAKAFSQKGNMKKVMKIIKKKTNKHHVWKYVILHAHNRKKAGSYAKQLTTLVGQPPLYIMDISPAIGLNAGHGAVAAALMFT